MISPLALTLAVVAAALVALASNRLPADITMMGALVIIVFGGVLSPTQALAGFANPGLITIAALYIVAGALRDTGAIYWVAHRLLGQPNSNRGALLRLLLPSATLSAFLNNTTVVAMLIPAVEEWARRLRLPASRLLMPLSFTAILGGTCTLIGTSTNLVVDSLAQAEGLPAMGIFDIAWVGLPVLVVGGVFLLLFADRLLPSREAPVEQLEHAREYQVQMRVPAGSALAGRTIQDAGLRNLTHGYLYELQRGEVRRTAVGPEVTLQVGDQLGFIGDPETARELQRIVGLEPAENQARKLGLRTAQRLLVEVVLSPEFPLLDKRVRESAFRTRYQAAILSISRDGRRLSGKVGEQFLRVGDTLLLDTGEVFVEQFRFRRDFMLVSPLRDSTPPNFQKAPLAVGTLAVMLALNVLELVSTLEAALLAAGVLLATRCITVNRSRQNLSVNLPVLVVIGASFCLGEALRESGGADLLVSSLFAQVNPSPWLALALVYLLTMLFTELITNNAAAVLAFPIAVTVAQTLGVSAMPFVVVVMVAASASFITPLGYQTNLMVMGPGGYRFTDYARLGLPLSVLVAAVTLTIVPWLWPF